MGAVRALEEEVTWSDLEYEESPSEPALRQRTLKALFRELEAEKEARKAAESELADLQVSFSRLKVITFDAVQQRDDAMRLKEEAESTQEDFFYKLNEAILHRDDAIKQRDEAFRLRDDAIKERDNTIMSKDEMALQKDVMMHARNFVRSDVEAATCLLIAGADSITARVGSIKSFAAKLPRSSSHTGVTAVAFGFRQRIEEIVDELIRQLEMASKEKSNMREEMEQRHYKSAIEISELESSIQMLRDDLLEKTLELERWHDFATEKQSEFSNVEQLASEKLVAAEREVLALKDALHVKELKLRNLGASIKELLQLIFKTHQALANQACSFSPTQSNPVHIPSILPPGEDSEEGIRTCIDSLKDVLELFLKLSMTWKEQTDLRKKALEDLEGTVTRLIVEKKEVTNFLESALAVKREMLEAVSNLSVDSDQNLNTVAKNGEVSNGDAGSTHSLLSSSSNDILAVETLRANELKKLREEVFQLQQFLAAARGELELLRVTSERQSKELLDNGRASKENENKLCLAQDTIEALKTELTALGEDVFRWKQAATQEAEAGVILLEEVERLQAQVSVYKEQGRQLSDSLEDCKSKLHSKEEMAAAAIAARNAAEQSLRIADGRAVQLRKKIDDMVRQFELLEGKDDVETQMGWYKACWPYQWLHGRLPSSDGAEMDKLLEPFV